MFERLRTRLFRAFMNHHPTYWGTGGQITYIAPDWSEIRVEIPLNWRTRNYVGTIFGGSMYGAVDPIYMLMLIKRLGDDYVIWDKEADIRFKKPGQDTLTATFRMPDAELAAIRAALEEQSEIDRIYTVDLVDDEDVVHATVRKTLHITTDDQKRA